MTHLDLNTTGTPTAKQSLAMKAKVNQLIADSEFSGVSFYINGDYIGGRPNDRG